MLGENKRSLARHSFLVYDPLTKYSFLVDSGSDVSASPIDLAKPETKMFKTFKGPTSNANISCVGYVNLVLDFGFSKQFSWKFAVVNLTPTDTRRGFSVSAFFNFRFRQQAFVASAFATHTFIKKGKPLFSFDSK